MNYVPKINRRSFIVGAAAVGGGLALGLEHSVRRPAVVRAQDGSPEINAWVVIRPDDTVVIRIARSEMGQGTLTGLAQLVAEELECDWSKVTTEYPTPGQSVARKRVWGDFSTGGSRGIRTSHEYVRKGGAAARMMLIQAAANEWKVPASRVQRRQQRDHAQAVRPHDHLRQGRGGRRQARAAEGRRRSRIRRTGRSSASRSSASTPPTRSPASRSTASTSSCPACSTPRSRTARCSAAR